MTDIQFVAVVVAPLMAGAFGWGVAIWARHAGWYPPSSADR